MKKIILFLFISNFCFAQKIIKLYDKTPKGSETWNWNEKEYKDTTSKNTYAYNITDPTICIFLPDKEISTGTAILVVPGGGFHFLTIDNEGTEVAKFLNSKGIAAFVLKHRTIHCLTNNPQSEFMQKLTQNNEQMTKEVTELVPLAIQDAQVALKYINDNAKIFDLDPSKIGMMGFSAGGTITLGTIYDPNTLKKPKFIATIYPYVPENFKNIPTEKTPIFIALAQDDQLGFVKPNMQLFTDWKEAKQDVELHIFENGGHGFGIKKHYQSSDLWSVNFTDWLKRNGLTKKKYPLEWEKKYTQDQLEELEIANREKTRKDWANLERYGAMNLTTKTTESLKTRIVLIGDSITEGWVLADKTYFKANHFVGRGIGGQTSPQNLLRFRQDVVELMPEGVIINIGINDIAENTGPYSEKYTMSNIQAMVEIAQANNLKVILASVLPASEFPWRKSIKNVPEKIISLNSKIEKLAILKNVTYLDYFNALKDKNNGLSKAMAEDGVHPNLKCYKIMEKLAQDAVAKTLTK